MERIVPSRGSDEIALYLRTYYSLLRSTREVQIKSLIEAHTRINSALHVYADEQTPDMAALIYTILRLPDCIAQTRLVIMGQSEQVFAEHGFPEVESWNLVGATGRRRKNYFDGHDTLAVYIASHSDIDDLIPTLTAYQIERRKLYLALSESADLHEQLKKATGTWIADELLGQLAHKIGVSFEDADRLRRIWKEQMADNILEFALTKQSISVRLLAGSLTDYRRATRRWWLNVNRHIPEITFEDHPVYFVSSNTHSMVNLVSGFALRMEPTLVEFIENQVATDLQNEYYDILDQNVPSNRENFLYYALKKYEGIFPEMRTKRINQERELGINRAPSQHVFDIEVQVIELAKLVPDCMDPRLIIPGIEKLKKSNALIINIDFPLGMAAYLVLSEIARNIAKINGIYITGKAATLNGRIGDVMIPNVVHDEQSLNTFLFNNCFVADDVAPYLVYGTVMDNQKAISALGTFLQNEDYMDIFYREGYTIIEMEAGPFLSSIFEMIRPQRFPKDELVNLYNSPFPIGILHYASDTPLSKGKNLGSQNLSYFGMDPTYATMVAILRQIITEEIKHCS